MGEGGSGREEDLSRRGKIRYVGHIPELPGLEGAAWVGIELDEPTGRGDGSVERTRAHGESSAGNGGGPSVSESEGDEDSQPLDGEEREREPGRARRSYFTCADKHAVFVRPERVIVGDYPVLSIEEEEIDSDMEEL